ncbi:MAG TPA: MOSC N-terminal beta barrel domain-containing protein [Candidatus Saccharimonadia bacterium]|nr:MOSC N-terminal beta barrel domain-containing protein [Candidatus Saccharimonadia bacterium]
MRLVAIHLHPLKSGATFALDAARVERRGLEHDRRWLVVDASGRFVTGRQEPRLVLIRATPFAGGIDLDAPGMSSLRVLAPEGNADRVEVTVWDDRIDAAACDGAADAWLSRDLGRPARLAYMDELAPRPVDPAYARPDDRVSVADAFPLLLIGTGAIDGLNARLSTPLPVERFRPNLVVETATPHAEDGWARIRIGALELELVKPCTRCAFTTVDPASGTFDGSGEPLATLKTYRRTPKGITFGQNAIPRSFGELRLGDPVEVLEHRL